ncbi:MAG: glycosyltransferase [Christensenellaceae bacterium]
MKIEKPYCVMEGIATENIGALEKKSQPITEIEKNIVYTGTLHERFGILNLLQAFKEIPYPNYRLIICGIGDSEKKIIEASKQDSRIIFMGQLSRDEILKLQKVATVLVNPRQNNEEFTKYSFPSKNLEYLSSGIPLVAYKLDGILDEYDDYINYVEDNSIVSLRNKLIEVCEWTYEKRELFGYKAQKFVLEQKNQLIQTKKIIELIEL